ncbi:MAG: hypothetical protein GY899_00475 [Verrucomicrobiaceae bacterium]|nr:hypothetical protein [Verrucomicrobiaceae bacterium]
MHNDQLLSIDQPEIVRQGEGFSVSLVFELRGRAETVHITVPRWPGNPRPEWVAHAAVILGLPIAMATGLPMKVNFPVSMCLLSSLQDIQEMLSAWNEELSVIEVQANPMIAPAGKVSDGQTATFFSGGVDSFHTLHRHRDVIEHAVFVHGFDIPLSNVELRREVSAHVSKATDVMEINLIEVETDVRDFSDRFCHWGSHYCGAAMAAVAYVFGGDLNRVLIPATMTLSHLGGFGTHPMLDPKWSSEAIDIVHEGLETRRIDKMRELPDVALRHLRVCWENIDGKYNCGRCEKCIRTLANLRALGITDRCSTFECELDLGALANLELDHPLVEAFLIETREEAEAKEDHELAAAVSKCLAEYHGKRLLHDVRQWKEGLFKDIGSDKVVRRIRDRVFDDAVKDNPEWVIKEYSKMLPDHKSGLFEVFWEKERKWLLGRVLKKRLMRSLRHVIPGLRRRRER